VVEIRVGNALDLLPLLETEEPFDMVFIDADKPPYVEYFQWAVRLARPGALIVADNVIRNGKDLTGIVPMRKYVAYSGSTRCSLRIPA